MAEFTSLIRLSMLLGLGVMDFEIFEKFKLPLDALIKLFQQNRAGAIKLSIFEIFAPILLKS